MSDSFYANRALGLHCDGPNGSTVFTDNSPTPKTVTAHGNAALSATWYQFGTASAHFDGTGDYLTIGTATDWTFLNDSSKWTLRGWFKPASFAAENAIFSTSNGGTGEIGTYCAILATTRLINLQIYRGSSGTYLINGSFGTAFPNDGLAHHIEITADYTLVSGNIVLYIDGVASGTLTKASSANAGTPTNTLTIGGFGSTGTYNGYIDDFEILNGVVLDAANFNPPTSAFETLPTWTAPLVLPMLVVSAGTGVAAPMVLPMFSAAGYTGSNIAGTLPITVQMSATGHDAAGENAADIALPMLQVSAFTGIDSAVSLPAMAASAQVTSTVLLTAAIDLPSLQAQATCFAGAIATADMNLPLFTMIGYAGVVCDVTLGSFQMQASGTAGTVLSAAITLPLFELSAQGTANDTITADLLLPALTTPGSLQAWIMLPGLTLTAIGSATVTATYEAYSLNLKHRTQPNEAAVDELTHYTNFPFQRIVRWKNSYFGMAADGLYLLQGTTDFASPPVPIAWSWRSAITDFDSPQKKTVLSAYFAGRMPPAATITHYVGETSADAYSFTTPRGATAQNYRQLFGRGAKDRYHAFGASGAGELMLPSIEFNVATLARRI